MKLALIDLGLIWIIVLGGVMMTDVVKHYNDNRTDSPVQNDNTRGKTLFEYIVLETVKTKILMKLGLRSPPKIEHETAAILRDDATFLPLAQHDAAVARSASVAKKLDREFGEHSKVVIFAELGKVIVDV